MKNIKTWLPALLSVLFIAAGVWMLLTCIQTEAYYTDSTAQAQQALAALDVEAAEALETELAAVREENTALEVQLQELHAENETLDADLAAAQAEYDRLEQLEDTAYYQTILESLQEGISRVAQYINGTE